MTNIFKESSGPYVLALLVGGFGWLLNTTISELKSLRLVEYSVSQLQENGADFFQLDISNVSHSLAAKNLIINIQCKVDGKDCIKNDAAVGSKVNWQVAKGDNYIEAETTVIADGVPREYKLAGSLSPRAEIHLKIPAAVQQDGIRLIYAPGKDDDSDVIFRKAPSLESFLLRNYLWMLLTCFASIFIILFTWIAAAAAEMVCGIAKGKSKGEGAPVVIDNAP